MGRPKAFDEDAALDAAAQLFWSQGYEGTSVSDLEAGMEMGRQSIYNAFGDKRALFLKALERYTRWNGDTLQDTLFTPGAGLDAIRAYFNQQVDFVAPDGPRRGCLVANSIVEMAGVDERIDQRCRINQETVLRGFEHALGNAVRAGELPEDLDVSATARMLMTQSYGVAVMSKTGASRKELHDGVDVFLGRLK
jgi:TetR/AcrR family transcriptional repressor of nem operon